MHPHGEMWRSVCLHPHVCMCVCCVNMDPLSQHYSSIDHLLLMPDQRLPADAILGSVGRGSWRDSGGGSFFPVSRILLPPCSHAAGLQRGAPRGARLPVSFRAPGTASWCRVRWLPQRTSRQLTSQPSHVPASEQSCLHLPSPGAASRPITWASQCRGGGGGQGSCLLLAPGSCPSVLDQKTWTISGPGTRSIQRTSLSSVELKQHHFQPGLTPAFGRAPSLLRLFLPWGHSFGVSLEASLFLPGNS